MFGVPLDGPSNVMCENQGLVNNMNLSQSTLVKKHNTLNYHVVRIEYEEGILRVGKEDTETNLADLLKIYIRLAIIPQVTPICFRFKITLVKVSTSHRYCGTPLRQLL